MKKQADWDRVNQIIELFDKDIYDACIEYRKDIFSKPRYTVIIRNGGQSIWTWGDEKEYIVDGNVTLIIMFNNDYKKHRFDVGKKYEK